MLMICVPSCKHGSEGLGRNQEHDLLRSLFGGSLAIALTSSDIESLEHVVCHEDYSPFS